MGRGRTRAVAVAGLVGTVALLAGCGESRHANEQRPQVSTRVSVTISSKEVIVQPVAVGTGPDATQEIPQNQDHPEPPIETKRPLDVTFVAANQTATDIRLLVQGGGESARSETIFARSPGIFQVDLPTGSYTVTAVNMPEARPAHLKVGSYRASSQNDVLLP